MLLLLKEMEESTVNEIVTAWGGIMTGEIPVAGMVGARSVEAFEGLEDKLYRRLHACGAQHERHLAVDILYRERLIDRKHTVLLLMFWFTDLRKAGIIRLPYNMRPPALLEQRNRCAESAELLQPCHVDTIIIGVTDLRCTGDHHYLLGVQAVEDLKDALSKSCSTHHRIVDDDKVIFIRPQRTERDVIDMRCQIIT